MRTRSHTHYLIMSVVKGLPKLDNVDGKGLRIGIVHTRWNSVVVDALVKGVQDEAVRLGVSPSDISVTAVPGAFELPYTASQLIKERDPPDVVVCCGTLIKGETMHFEYICDAVSKGIMQLGIDSGVPVIFGVLTCLSDEQALARAGLTEGGHNHGTDWGTSAVEMARSVLDPSPRHHGHSAVSEQAVPGRLAVPYADPQPARAFSHHPHATRATRRSVLWTVLLGTCRC